MLRGEIPCRDIKNFVESDRNTVLTTKVFRRHQHHDNKVAYLVCSAELVPLICVVYPSDVMRPLL